MKKISAALLASALMITTTGCSLEKLGERPFGTESSAVASEEVSVSDPVIEEPKVEDEQEASSEATSEDELAEEEDTRTGYDSTKLMDGTPLSEKELSQIKEFLDDRGNNGFVMSSYRSPDKIDWVQVFYTGAGMENCDYSQEALNAYLKASGYDSVEYDLIALSGKDVRDFIKAKTGITDFDVNNLGMTYIADADVFFAQVSDTNYMAVQCLEGVRSEDCIQVKICGEWDYIGKIGFNKILTLTETEDPQNPYMFYSSRELWEEYSTVVKGYNYETGEETYYGVRSFPAGMEIGVIEDNSVVGFAWPFYGKDNDKKQFDKVKEIVTCDADDDGNDDIIAVLSDGKETAVALCLGFFNEWGEREYTTTKDGFPEWISENVTDLTGDNIVKFIKNNTDELISIVGGGKPAGEALNLNLTEKPSWSKIGIAPSEGMNFASFEFDLDKDGISEAFVLEGYADEPIREDYDENYNYWYVSRIWSVDESGVATEIFDLDKTYLATKQYIYELGDKSFLTLNGYWGREPVGMVFGLTDSMLSNVAPDTWPQGQKNFANNGELLWNLECYCSFCDITKGVAPLDAGFSGRSIILYRLHFVDGKFCHYGAKEISLSEAKKMANLDLSGIDNTESVQVILRDNNELDINYVEKSKYTYTFYFKTYKLSNDSKNWALRKTGYGFFDIVPGQENTWSVLHEKM